MILGVVDPCLRLREIVDRHAGEGRDRDRREVA
jgi:hypothetical protein